MGRYISFLPVPDTLGGISILSDSLPTANDEPPDPFYSTSTSAANSMVLDTATVLQSLEDKVQKLEQQLQVTKDIQDVQGLITHYTTVHDEAFYDLDARQEWENLFTADATAQYPFGKHCGRQGLGDFAWREEVSVFEQCALLSSNYYIKFADDRQSARVRSNCSSRWMKKRENRGEHFDEGGFYHWIVRREPDGEWKIQSVHLTITWKTGTDPLGLGGAEYTDYTKMRL